MQAEEVIKAIDNCPTTTSLIDYAKTVLGAAGFQELKETEKWSDIPQKFYVTRDGRQLIAINKKDFSKGFFVTAIADAPCIKAKPISKGSGANCIQVRIAPYGSMNFYQLPDNDLRAAGRVLYNDNGEVKSTLFVTETPIAIIPNLAIHMDRSSSVSSDINLETQMNPILEIDNGEPQISQEHSDALLKAIADAAHIQVEQILDFEVSFVDAQPTVITGIDKKLVNGPRLGQNVGAIQAISALANSKDPEAGLNGLVLYDNFYIGKHTRCSIKSNFLKTTLQRIGMPETFPHNTLLLAITPLQGSNPNGNSTPFSLGKGVYLASNPTLLSETELYIFSALQKFVHDHGMQLSKSSVKQDTYDNDITSQIPVKAAAIGIPVIGLKSPRQLAYVDDINVLGTFLKSFYDDCLSNLTLSP